MPGSRECEFCEKKQKKILAGFFDYLRSALIQSCILKESSNAYSTVNVLKLRTLKNNYFFRCS